MKVVLLILRTVFAVCFWLFSFLQLKLWARIPLQIGDIVRRQFPSIRASTFTNVLALHFKVKFDQLFLQRENIYHFLKVPPFFIKDAKNHGNRLNHFFRKTSFKNITNVYKISKKNFAPRSRFLYISLPSLHDYHVELLSFTFSTGTWTQDNDALFYWYYFFFNLDTVLYNATPEKLTNIWWPIERRAIRTIDFDTAWIQSLRDVVATSSSSLLKLPLMTKMVTIVMTMKMSTVGWWLPWRWWWWKKKWTRKEKTKNLQLLHDISSLPSF